jgi:hypothetical protein
MIHNSRKKCGKENTIVYGAATDGFEYRFWRIDNKSVVSLPYSTSKIAKRLKVLQITKNRVRDWTYSDERPLIYSIFRMIIRAAILSSPTTSPIKSEEFAERFRDGRARFDFGVSSQWRENIEILEIDENDPNYEII